MSEPDFLLLTAGPVAVAEEIRNIFSQPMVYHRSADFVDIFNQVTEGLKYLFQTENDTIILTSSGTGAMEAGVTNFFSPNDRVLIASNGKFSERWKEICLKYRLEIAEISLPWGKSVNRDQLLQAIKAQSDLKGIFLTHCETSTGAVTDLSKIVPEIRPHTDALIIVDAISSIPALPFQMDSWGIDVAITASQKGLGLPPGMAFVAVSPRAWVAAELAELPRYYFDLIKYRQAHRLKIGSAFTPSALHVLAAKFALDKIAAQTLPAIWREREAIATFFRGELAKRNISIFPEYPSNSLTALDFQNIAPANEIIRELHDKRRIIVSRGQGKLQNKIIRVGHLVNVGKNELKKLLDALDAILAERRS
ncbi:MAG: alanine--glyoxylate aminotransferase family protein [Calditrichaeota bacterium]|nr:alanine--glyoxylate aminotransferase family protein [Calditrichota bacterium]